MREFLPYLVICLLPFLMGCGKDVTMSEIFNSKLPPTPVDKDPTDGTMRIESNYPGLALLSNQVLGTKPSPKFMSKTRDAAAVNGYIYDHDEAPLSSDLANTKFTKKLVAMMVEAADGKRDFEDIKVSGKDFHNFVSAALTDIESLYSDEHTKVQVGKMYGKERVLTRQGMLFAYVKAYLNGNFVDRSGNIVSKPTISGTGVSNSTVTGLLTVFLEAFFDYALSGKSPLLMQKDAIVTYVQAFMPDPQNPGQFVQRFKEVKVNNWFTYNNNQPTAFSYVPVEEILDTTKITPQKARLIRFVADLAGEKSKALSGLIFRAFGSVDVGLVVFGKFNIGDNQILAQLLDTTFEVSSKRMMELASYQFFLKYDSSLFGIKGMDIDPLLLGFEKD